jgi:hypothetical protein
MTVSGVGESRTGLIPKLRFHEPVRNLPNHAAGRCAEERMVSRFGRAYRAVFPDLHHRTTKTSTAMARQIPVNGYGIADFVAVSWQPSPWRPMVGPLAAQDFVCEANPVIRAFELKLRDWRKALAQANRYRFYAHVAIVVLPPRFCAAALKFLDTFQLLEVGLWSFDSRAGRIIAYSTPRPSQPVDTRNCLKALRLVAKATKALPVV